MGLLAVIPFGNTFDHSQFFALLLLLDERRWSASLALRQISPIIWTSISMNGAGKKPMQVSAHVYWVDGLV
jgi:hypothetical protein